LERIFLYLCVYFKKHGMVAEYIQYAKHYLAVDCVIFGYEDEELKLLLYPRGFEPAKGKWSLMGGFVDENESTEDAALRILRNTTGLTDIYLEQVNLFSAVDRDPGDRVISMAYYALIRIDMHDYDKVREHGAHWWPINRLPELIFDHKDMVIRSLERLQMKASLDLIGHELLPDMFTLTQLRNLYQAIFQRQLDPGNFRKKVLSLDVLEKLPIKETYNSKKGSFYYRFKANPPERNYDRVIKL